MYGKTRPPWNSTFLIDEKGRLAVAQYNVNGEHGRRDREDHRRAP